MKKIFFNKSYKELLLFFFGCLILYKGVENYQFFFSKLGKLIGTLIPFFWGIGVAFILNPAMMFLENHFKRLKRSYSLMIVYLLFFGIIGLFAFVVAPVITSNIKDLYAILVSLPDNINSYMAKLPNGDAILNNLGLGTLLKENTADIAKWLLNFTDIDVWAVFSKVINITSGLLDFLIGIFVSIYLLYDKANLLAYIKKLMIAFLKEEKAKPVFEYFDRVNYFFYNFLVGKLIDSTIIGILCFIGLFALRTKYSLLFSIIVGVTNMIPYFGPFIGAIPAVLITLIYNPIKALWVALFILALQQFDGWFLGPRILGNTVGAKPLTIIFAILVGGSFGGALGMLLAVPIYMSLAILWNTFIDKRVQRNQDIINKEKDYSSDENIGSSKD